MGNDSVGALHVALAAAVVGWLVFSASHSLAVWKKRNAGRGNSFGMVYVGLFLCAAGLVAGWLNSEMTRRAGVILGTDFFVVRAHTRTTPHLLQGDSIHEGTRLATFDDPEGDREEEHIRGEIAVLEQQIAVSALKPLLLNPELLRLSQNASDSQRARLTQLGYGVLRAGLSPFEVSNDSDLVAAQRVQSEAAKAQLERTASLVHEGLIARDKLEPAEAAAEAAAQQLREREQQLEAARKGFAEVSEAEAAILHDGDRAKAERAAELSELGARLSELRTSLLQLHLERSVIAPFSGTVVYRHLTPALASDGQVILALAKGPGFFATVQLPAREAAMMTPGEELRIKLQHSLVSEEIHGRLKSVELVPGYPERRDILVDCDLPPEQFAAFSSGTIPVTLLWRPPLLSERFAQAGVVCLLVSIAAWLLTQISAKIRHENGLNVEAEHAAEAGYPMFEHPVRTDTIEAVKPHCAAHSEPSFANLKSEEVDRVLAQLGLTTEVLAEEVR